MKDKKVEIVVRCQASELLSLDSLRPLQGTLKTLSDVSRKKLRHSIEQHGIRFPFFYWQKDENKYTIDGHQRCLVLKEMLDDGFTLRDGLIPCDRIDADSEQQAREMILLASSRYGQINRDSFMEFIQENALDLSALTAELDLPEINLEAISQEKIGGEVSIKRIYSVVIDCEDELQQQETYDTLQGQGFVCRVLTL